MTTGSGDPPDEQPVPDNLQSDDEPEEPGNVVSPGDDPSGQGDIPVSRIVLRQAEMLIGPLPHPRILAQYNDVLENGAERIFRLAEGHSEHRKALTWRQQSAEIWRSFLGLGAAFVVAMSFFGGSVYLVIKGHDTAGIALGTIDIAGLVGVFIGNTLLRQRAAKREENPTNEG